MASWNSRPDAIMQVWFSKDISKVPTKLKAKLIYCFLIYKENLRVSKVNAPWAYEASGTAKANNAEAKMDQGKCSISLSL